MGRISTLLLIISLFCASGYAQGTGTTIRHGPTLPSTCVAGTGQVYAVNSGSTGLYECLTTNTWTLVGQTSTGSVKISGPAVAGEVPLTSSASAAAWTPRGTVNGYGPNVIYASDYVRADSQFVSDATWAATTTPTITIGGTDPPFASTDTGKACWGMNANGDYTLNIGTFTYSSATTGVCSGTGTGAVSGNGFFVWGTNDTAGWVSAWTAFQSLPRCGLFVMPAGYSMTQKGIGNTQQANCFYGRNFFGELTGMMIKGQGRQATHIVPMPSFDFSTATAAGVFFSPTAATTASLHAEGFSINGLGQNLTGVSTSPAPFVMATSVNGTIRDVYITGWGGSESTTLGGVELVGQGSYLFDVAVDKVGKGCQIHSAAAGATMFNVYGGDSAGPGLCIHSGALWDYGGQYGPTAANVPAVQVENGGEYHVFGGGYQQGNANTWVMSIDTGGLAFLNGFKGLSGAPNTNAYGLVFTGTGVVHAKDSLLYSGATHGWAGTAGTFYDECGNTFSGPLTSWSTGGGKFIPCPNEPAPATATPPAITGTGACGTVSTQTGNLYTGKATCTGSTGASTFIITPGITATNGWRCNASDQTTAANLLQQSASSTTTCTLTAAAVNANDVIVFTVVPY